jgi:hypothetical protein
VEVDGVVVAAGHDDVGVHGQRRPDGKLGRAQVIDGVQLAVFCGEAAATVARYLRARLHDK